MAQKNWNTDFVKTFPKLADFQKWNSDKKKPLPDAEILAAWNEANPAPAAAPVTVSTAAAKAANAIPSSSQPAV